MTTEQGSKQKDQAAAADAAPGSQIADLMKPGPAAKAAPDLDHAALQAAEEALAAGQRALAAARAQTGEPPRRSRLRQNVLRGLLAFNLLLMVGVMLLPAPVTDSGPVVNAPPQPIPAPVAQGTDAPQGPGPQAPAGPRAGSLYDQALRSAAEGNYDAAIVALERYLAESPRLHVGQQCNVYHALAHYSFQLGNLPKSQEYDQKAAALLRSHTLPEDLVQMAQQAEQRGDAEAMRRLWSRFLLQQRQVPASMYRHVAEAYLKLGDSYRMEAGKAAEAARIAELERVRQRVRDEAAAQPPGERKAGHE